MLPTYLLYFFVAFVTKALLALAVCWLLLPAGRSCDACDAETLPIRMGPAGRLAAALIGGRLELRWCPRCGAEGVARGGRRGRRAAAGRRAAVRSPRA
jgi:hypothetical protein